MNTHEFEARFQSWVHTNVPEFFAGIAPWYVERGRADGDSLSYFRAHLPRFWAMINAVRDAGHEPKRAAELGSFYPYTTRFWSCNVDLFDIMPRIAGVPGYSADGVTLHDANLVTDPIGDPGAFDLVILSEVMEHLPCDLFAFERKVIDVLAPGGLLIATYPMHGHNAKDYDQTLGPPEVLHHEHVREFTDETVPLFFRGLQFMAEREVNYPAYGRIVIRTYRKGA